MKTLRKALCFLLCMMLCTACASAEQERQVGVVLVERGGNVRAEADAESAIVGRASANTYYGCYANENGWYRIKLTDGVMGYISHKRGTFFTTVAPDSKPAYPLAEEAQRHFVPGDVVLFGAYEQDNDPDTTAEPIEWIVLDRDDEKGQLLLVTRYAVERQHYHTTNSNATWETSGLRVWLNDTFLQTAFTADEQELIALSPVTADQNSSFRTTSGSDTTDRVFLLSMAEAESYMTPEMRLCIPTAYVIVRNGYSDPQTGGCWWWLRTPGHNRMHSAYVNWKGEISGKGYGVIANKGAVRPALRIDLSLLP